MSISDLRVAVRTLRRSPGFAFVTLLMLALGIGASASIFALVNAVLIQPLPYAGADRLVMVRHAAPGLELPETGQSFATYRHYRDRSRAFEHLALFNENVVNLKGDLEAERVEVALVTASFFSTFGARPALGRLLLPADNAPGAPNVVVIGHELWRRHYGADSSIIGRTIELNSAPKQVVGVVERGFGFPRRDTQVWYAMTIDAGEDGSGLSALFYTSVGRLRPGIDAAEAEAELNRLIPSLAESGSGISGDMLAQSQLRALVRPLKDHIVGDSAASLWLILGGTFLVLLIACANIASLVLIRSEHRHREVALRTALGATGRDILAHALTESLVLAVVGGALGLLLADSAIQVLRTFGPANLPRLHEVAIDGWTVAFVAVLSVFTAVLFGALPNLGRRPADLTTALKDGGQNVSSGRASQRARSMLVAFQVALSLTLLVTSGLLVRSLQQLNRVDLGFEPANVLTLEMALPHAPYPDYAAEAALWHGVLDDIRRIPGVEAAGAATSLPLSGSAIDAYLVDPVIVEGERRSAGEPAPRVQFAAVTAGWFDAMGIPFIEGRRLRIGDRADATNPVFISEGLARRLFGDASPIGRRLRRADYEGRAWFTVAGVVGSVRRESVTRPIDEVVYVPVLDRAAETYPSHMSLAIRTSVPPLSLASAVRQVVRAIDPALPIANIGTMEDIVDASTARTSFTMLLLLVASTVSLVLGAVGIYGIVSYAVSRRTHEIGIRIALGARAADVGRMVLRQGGVVVAIGLGVGLALALASTRLVRSQLHEVSPTDPLTFASMALLLVAVAALACWIPARRAARIDPVIALRSE